MFARLTGFQPTGTDSEEKCGERCGAWDNMEAVWAHHQNTVLNGMAQVAEAMGVQTTTGLVEGWHNLEWLPGGINIINIPGKKRP